MDFWFMFSGNSLPHFIFGTLFAFLALNSYLSNGQPITGATNNAYTLTQNEVGKNVSVKASYTDLENNSENVSSNTALVNSPITNNTIEGTAGSDNLVGTNDKDYIIGKAANDAINGGMGDDIIEGGFGEDELTGGGGNDTFVYKSIEELDDDDTITDFSVGDILDLSAIKNITFFDAEPASTIRYGATDLLPVAWGRSDGRYFYVNSKGIYFGRGNSVFLEQTTPTSGIFKAVAGIDNTINQPPTGSVTISGTPAQNETLIVSNTIADSNGLGALNYQWSSNDLAISGATQTSYLLTQTDVGKAISVKASYMDGLNKFEIVTSSKVTVTNVNDLPTGSVSITGTPTQGQILTVSNSLADVDGLGVVSNQWLSNNVAISGANQATYTLTAGDVAKLISVKASYVDLLGTAESVTSSATALVSGSQTAPTGNVSNKIVALVFLADSDMEYKVANSSTKIFGCAGDQTLSFDSGVFNVHPDANVEKLVFKESMSNYKFKQSGNSLDIYNSADILITNTGLQDDSNGTQLQFLEGIVETAFVPTATGLTITISNQTVSNQNPEAISIIGVAHIG